MIVPSSDIVLISQLLRHFFTFVARTTVDDAACVRLLRLDEADNLLEQLLDLWADFVVEIGAIERLLELFATLYTQGSDNVVLHLVLCCGR